MRQMSPLEAKSHLASSDVLLIDVREPAEFQICSIPGSRLIPMQQIPTRLDEFGRDQELIILCHHGIRSLQVAAFLEQRGFHRVINLSGGIDAWAEQIEPAMPRY
jgi:rhodanese-related sulfurtransferase